MRVVLAGACLNRLALPCRYSVFTVKSVHFPAKITGDSPITIHLEAAIDNVNEDETLPLAPWH